MHHDSDVLDGFDGGTKSCHIFKVGAVGETVAIGEVGDLRDTIEEYFPLGVEVHNIDIVVEKRTDSYNSPSRRVSSTSRKKPDKHTDAFEHIRKRGIFSCSDFGFN